MTDPLPTLPDQAGPEVAAHVPWRRLDPRMLLVHPVQELIRFLPLVIGAFVLGSTGDRNNWQLVGIAIPIALGVVRFMTTRYRITPTQVELQRGLLSRKVLTARLDRVRAVELTSPLIHRVLGLARVEIGTASGAKQDDEKFALDGLPLAQARTMRAALLHRTGPGATTGGDPDAAPGDAADSAPPGPNQDQVLLRIDYGWVRFAPLTSSGNVIAAGLLAVLAQLAEQVGITPEAETIDAFVTGLSVVLALAVALVLFVVLGAVFAILGYLVTNWDFALLRDVYGRSFQIRRGLFTSTETSLERERVRGIEVGEPLGLRLVGAGRLSAVVTGLSRGERSSTQLVPPAPRPVVDGVGAQLIGDRSPLEVALHLHGPAARRRRFVRALAGAAVLPVAAVLLAATTSLPWWLLLPTLLPVPVAMALAADRYRRLGHALTGDYLVLRSGSLLGRRVALQRQGIIGWNVQQSWFQRRAGLATLVATTAAGQQGYAALDIPLDLAIALADAAVPGLLTPFLDG